MGVGPGVVVFGLQPMAPPAAITAAEIAYFDSQPPATLNVAMRAISSRHAPSLRVHAAWAIFVLNCARPRAAHLRFTRNLCGA